MFSPYRFQSDKVTAVVTLSLLAVTQFLDFLNLSALTIAIPTIAKDLDIPHGREGWILISYSLALSAFMLPFGRLGDICGHRNIFIIGLGVMTVSNVSSALAGSWETLALYRGLQGLGAAATIPNASAIIARTYPPGPDRNKAFARLGAASAIGSAAGLVVGGLFSTLVGWRFVFAGMIPICAIVSLLSIILLPIGETSDSRDSVKFEDFDVAATLAWLGGISLIIYAQLAMLHSAQPKEYALIGALFSTAAQIGGPVGLAVLTAAMNSAMEVDLTDEQKLVKSYDVGNWVIVMWELAGVAIAGTYALVAISQRRKDYEAVLAHEQESGIQGEQRPLLRDRENAN
ncbi:hypothetical protein HDU88_007842 [Geranomyces variabilis]|nr:hypothetical protein HDU88_007842 [Geranomyces variabilis]